MEQNSALIDKFDREDAVLKQLRWSAWLNILNFVGIICLICTLAMETKFGNDSSYHALLTVSLACVGMTYIFSSIMCLLSWSSLSSFDNKLYIKIIKIICFIPIANVSMIYIVMSLGYQKKKLIGDLIKNNGK
ncbi:MAG: hypothetical protein LBQ45_00670 [Mycoplasmataceae bacterium]|nr:hypothetical protein [Mycoplasmataceae bacterium]